MYIYIKEMIKKNLKTLLQGEVHARDLAGDTFSPGAPSYSEIQSPLLSQFNFNLQSNTFNYHNDASCYLFSAGDIMMNAF